MKVTFHTTALKLTLNGNAIRLAPRGPPVKLTFRQTPVKIAFELGKSIVIRVGIPGLRGAIGPTGPQGTPGVGIPVTDLRYDRELAGTKNGTNKIFTLPGGDKGINEVVGVKVAVWINGVRKHEGAGDDFTISESGGSGTGYDTITFVFIAPISRDRLVADYFLFS